MRSKCSFSFPLNRKLDKNLFPKETVPKLNSKQILDHKLIVEKKAEQIKIYGSLKTNNNVNKLCWVISVLSSSWVY